MVECLAEYACEQPTETLLDFSAQAPSSSLVTCDFRRLLLSNPKHYLGNCCLTISSEYVLDVAYLFQRLVFALLHSRGTIWSLNGSQIAISFPSRK